MTYTVAGFSGKNGRLDGVTRDVGDVYSKYWIFLCQTTIKMAGKAWVNLVTGQYRLSYIEIYKTRLRVPT